MINQGCDDKNLIEGDGCSGECEIEDGYECEYEDEWEQSICYKKGYHYEFEAHKDLFSNTLYIEVTGDGISSLLAPLMIVCEGSF